MKGFPVVVSKFCVLLALLFSVQCTALLEQLPTFDKNDANRRIEAIKTWLSSSESAGVYNIRSEDTLVKTIMFVEDPAHHFALIRDMDMTQFWENVGLYDAFMYGKNKGKRKFHFRERLIDLIGSQDEEKGYCSAWFPGDPFLILTFLLLNCQSGDYEVIIKDLYMEELIKCTRTDIGELKKREDWKRIVDEFGVERTEQMKRVVKRLGNSGFEKEFKEYLFARYPGIRKSS